MYIEQIPENAATTTLIKIKYDCDGGFERCGKEWTLKLKDAQKNFEKNGGKHVCRQCGLKNNNPAKRDEVKAKTKKTNLERYGASCAMNTAENIAGRVERMFGSEEAKQQIVEKRRQTSIERYGADHIMKTEEGKERMKEAFQDRYGADHPMQTEEVKAKTAATVRERFGVENVAQAPEVRLKMAQTTLERYGVEHYNQLPEMKDYLRDNCKEWLAESYEAGGPNKGTIRPETWNDKQRKTVTDLMMLGLWKSGYPRSRKGFCFPQHRCKKQRVYFRSSYEAIYCYYLDNNPNVEWFSVEAFRIPYDYDGKTRYYIPDFLIKWTSSDSMSIRELKAEFMSEDEQVQIKAEHAAVFATNRDMDFEMLCCKDIKALGIDFDHLKEIGFVQSEA